MRDKDENKSNENLNTVVDRLIELEQMATDLPKFRQKIHETIDGLLSDCRLERGLSYLQTIAGKLKEEASGKGRMVIDNHGCFRGTAIVMRNQATSKQTIDDVLKALEEDSAGRDRPQLVGDRDRIELKKQYDAFEALYNNLLDQYLKPSLDFDKNRETSLAQLKKSLQDLVSKLSKVTAPNPVWGPEIKAQIPVIMAHIFAIWTLRDSKAYFDAGDVPNRKECLKKPHPSASDWCVSDDRSWSTRQPI